MVSLLEKAKLLCYHTEILSDAKTAMVLMTYSLTGCGVKQTEIKMIQTEKLAGIGKIPRMIMRTGTETLLVSILIVSSLSLLLAVRATIVTVH